MTNQFFSALLFLFLSQQANATYYTVKIEQKMAPAYWKTIAPEAPIDFVDKNDDGVLESRLILNYIDSRGEDYGIKIDLDLTQESDRSQEFDYSFSAFFKNPSQTEGELEVDIQAGEDKATIGEPIIYKKRHKDHGLIKIRYTISGPFEGKRPDLEE